MAALTPSTGLIARLHGIKRTKLDLRRKLGVWTLSTDDLGQRDCEVQVGSYGRVGDTWDLEFSCDPSLSQHQVLW